MTERMTEGRKEGRKEGRTEGGKESELLKDMSDVFLIVNKSHEGTKTNNATMSLTKL